MSIRMSLKDGLAAGSLLRHAFIVFRYVRGDFSGMFGNSGWYVKALEDLERAGRMDEALMVVLVIEGLLIELADLKKNLRGFGIFAQCMQRKPP